MDAEEMAVWRWMGIVDAVFDAESRVMDAWGGRMDASCSLSPDEKEELYEEYLRAVAMDILGYHNQEGRRKGPFDA